MTVVRRFAARVACGVLSIAAVAMAGRAEALPCATTDVSLTIGGTTYAPTTCADGINSGGKAEETANLNAAFGTSLLYLDRSNSGSSNGIGRIIFSVAAPAANQGSWTVSWLDSKTAVLPNLPLTIDLAVGLFGGGTGAGYLLEDVLLPIFPSSGTGTFDINFTNARGKQPDLAHLTLAGAPAVPGPVAQASEPLTLTLVGTGLIGLYLLRRRDGPNGRRRIPRPA